MALVEVGLFRAIPAKPAPNGSEFRYAGQYIEALLGFKISGSRNVPKMNLSTGSYYVGAAACDNLLTSLSARPALCAGAKVNKQLVTPARGE